MPRSRRTAFRGILAMERSAPMVATARIFVHGVPDSPAVWQPLLRELDLDPALTHTPALPGFHEPAPAGFLCTKDEYVDWLLGEVDALHASHGPVDIVGHDWGALLALRVVCRRPRLFRTWTLSSAVLDPDYRGHWMARAWNTPVLGEVAMGLTASPALQVALQRSGLPRDVAAEEARQWRLGYAAPSILRLYRSANGLRFHGPWIDDLARLPGRGLLVWGGRDPYCDVSVARRFAARWNVPLEVFDDAGHWAIAQKPREIACLLRRLWDDADAQAGHETTRPR